MWRMKAGRGVIALALAMGLGGCVKTHNLDMSVPPPGLRPQIGGADEIAAKVSISDQRLDQTTIGTGHAQGNRLILVANQPLPDVIRRGIETELAAYGFGIGNGPPYLLVDIAKADSSSHSPAPFAIDVWAEVELKASVLNAEGGTIYAKTYRGVDEGKAGNIWNGLDEAKPQLEKVLAMTIHAMVEDDSMVRALFSARPRR